MSEQTSLYLVPTPIGNLRDITLRAIDVLRSVDVVLAEDTRTSGKLLKHLEITKPLRSYHIHNEHQKLTSLIEELSSGTTMALISDAGTPAISDPGFLLVRECLKNDVKIECLPGPTAFVPALVKSGFAIDRFVFEGFLPHKKGRQTRLQHIAEEQKTVVLYESPHRLIKMLKQLDELLDASRRVSISRELTKMYEETVTGTTQELLAHFEKGNVKGEIVIVIEGKQ